MTSAAGSRCIRDLPLHTTRCPWRSRHETETEARRERTCIPPRSVGQKVDLVWVLNSEQHTVLPCHVNTAHRLLVMYQHEAGYHPLWFRAAPDGTKLSRARPVLGDAPRAAPDGQRRSVKRVIAVPWKRARDSRRRSGLGTAASHSQSANRRGSSPRRCARASCVTWGCAASAGWGIGAYVDFPEPRWNLLVGP